MISRDLIVVLPLLFLHYLFSVDGDHLINIESTSFKNNINNQQKSKENIFRHLDLLIYFSRQS